MAFLNPQYIIIAIEKFRGGKNDAAIAKSDREIKKVYKLNVGNKGETFGFLSILCF